MSQDIGNLGQGCPTPVRKIERAKQRAGFDPRAMTQREVSGPEGCTETTYAISQEDYETLADSIDELRSE